LRVDGGAAGNDLLLQFQADLLQRPVERPTVLETTALGAANLAGLAAGVFRSPAEFRRGIDRVFEPAMDPETARALRSRWRDAVERAKGWAKE
jgi:glycerol kinase